MTAQLEKRLDEIGKLISRITRSHATGRSLHLQPAFEATSKAMDVFSDMISSAVDQPAGAADAAPSTIVVSADGNTKPTTVDPTVGYKPRDLVTPNSIIAEWAWPIVSMGFGFAAKRAVLHTASTMAITAISPALGVVYPIAIGVAVFGAIGILPRFGQSFIGWADDWDGFQKAEDIMVGLQGADVDGLGHIELQPVNNIRFAQTKRLIAAGVNGMANDTTRVMRRRAMKRVHENAPRLIELTQILKFQVPDCTRSDVDRRALAIGARRVVLEHAKRLGIRDIQQHWFRKTMCIAYFLEDDDDVLWSHVESLLPADAHRM